MHPESPRAPLHAKLDALLDECDLVADNAAYGETLNDLEDFFLIQGRKFLQETFQEKLQERIKHAETTAEARQCSHCKKKRDPKMKKRKRSSPPTVRSLSNVAIAIADTARNTRFPLKPRSVCQNGTREA